MLELSWLKWKTGLNSIDRWEESFRLVSERYDNFKKDLMIRRELANSEKNMNHAQYYKLW
jgi:hypothetical protein